MAKSAATTSSEAEIPLASRSFCTFPQMLFRGCGTVRDCMDGRAGAIGGNQSETCCGRRFGRGTAPTPVEPPTAQLVLVVDVSGAELGVAVRANPLLDDIPFVMLSGTSESVVREALADYDAFVKKPYQSEALVRVVADLLCHGRSAKR